MLDHCSWYVDVLTVGVRGCRFFESLYVSMPLTQSNGVRELGLTFSVGKVYDVTEFLDGGYMIRLGKYHVLLANDVSAK